MATYYRRIGRDLQRSEATVVKHTLDYVAGTAEPQTITVSKNGAAFAASAGSGAVQVEANLYTLVIHPSDINTAGFVEFKCVGATDTQYLHDIRVVEHDPFDAVADILDDTGTTGVKLAANSVDAAALKADAIDEIVDQVWEELVDDHDGIAGSFAELLRIVRQALVGKAITDSTGQTLKIYDTDGVTLLVTLTMTEAGINITRTPS